jgi:hypothetical protein
MLVAQIMWPYFIFGREVSLKSEEMQIFKKHVQLD